MNSAIVEDAFRGIDAFLQRHPKKAILLFSLIFEAIIFVADYLAGYGSLFSIFYFAPICIAARYLTRVHGVTLSITASIAWLLTDIASASYPVEWFPIISIFVTRLGFFVVTVYMVGAWQSENRQGYMD